MEDATKKKQTSRRDRVTLDPVSVDRLNQWTEEANSQLKGTAITRADLVGFLISQHGPNLLPQEIQQLKAMHFDEADFAEWALKQLRRAKKQGETLSLVDLLKPVLPPASPRRSRDKKLENPLQVGEVDNLEGK
jgi:hypothetical protein